MHRRKAEVGWSANYIYFMKHCMTVKVPINALIHRRFLISEFCAKLQHMDH